MYVKVLEENATFRKGVDGRRGVSVISIAMEVVSSQSVDHPDDHMGRRFGLRCAGREAPERDQDCGESLRETLSAEPLSSGDEFSKSGNQPGAGAGQRG